MKKSRVPEFTLEECRQTVIDFHRKQAELKDMQSQLESEKKKFNSMMERLFEAEGLDKSAVFTNCGVHGDCERYTVTRVQRVSVDFDPERLERALGKEVCKSVIQKSYELANVDKLIAYLKGCGVDPKIFKSFLTVYKSVDMDELDRLEELGKISKDHVEGCYTVKRQKPYFTVSVKRGHDDGETSTKR